MRSVILSLALGATAFAAPASRTTVAHLPESLPLGWEIAELHTASDIVEFVVILASAPGGEEKLLSVASAVSTPENAQYGQHKSLSELRAILEPVSYTWDVMGQWLHQHECKMERMVSALRASCTVTNAAAALGTTLRAVKPSGGTPVWRHVGPLSVPTSVSAHVDLIAGLSEFFDGKAAKLRRSRAASRASEGVGSSGEQKMTTWYDNDPRLVPSVGAEHARIATVMNASSLTLTPQLQRELYSWPASPSPAQHSTTTGNPNASFGIAAFNDDFSPQALFASRAALGLLHLDPPQRLGATKFGDEVESDLDIQWSTGLGPAGAPSRLTNQASGFWILEWALTAVHGLDAPGRPRAWSISYGWPEDWQCGNHTNPPGQQVAQKGCKSLGYSSQRYIAKAEVYLAMLAAAGVTVLVSSGDSGAPGFASNNPVDLDRPAGSTSRLSKRCTLWNGSEAQPCQPAMFVLETPVAACVMAGGQDINLQSGCAAVQQDAGCLGLLDAHTNVTVQQAGIFLVSSDNGPMPIQSNTPGQHCSVDLLPFVQRLSGKPPRLANFGTPPITNCSASTLPALRNGSCTLRVLDGSKFEPKLGRAFQPSYPASSAWVTAVGATQLPADLPLAYGPDLQLAGVTEDVAGLSTLAGFTSGGGFSFAIPRPTWQSAAVQSYITAAASELPPAATWNASGRGFPDVSWNGHNELIFATKVPRPGNVGGTSASAPSLLALVATANLELSDRGASPIGHLAPLLYHLHAGRRGDGGGRAGEGVFRDVTRGDIKCTEKECRRWGFGATQGWDPASGLGTLRADGFLKAVLNLKAAVPQTNA